jgi:hypothetical protein
MATIAAEDRAPARVMVVTTADGAIMGMGVIEEIEDRRHFHFPNLCLYLHQFLVMDWMHFMPNE